MALIPRDSQGHLLAAELAILRVAAITATLLMALGLASRIWSN